MPTSGPISDDSRVLKLPHFRLVGADLFFMISSRPAMHLSPAQNNVWHDLEDAATMAQLRSRCGEAADAAIERFVAIGACFVATAPPPGERRRVLVVEPHSDDAALSVGATMWLRRDEIEFTLATVGSRSNFTSYFRIDRDYFDVAEITRLRKDEARIFMRALNGHHLAVGLPEATLRYRDGNWSRSWYQQHKVSVSANNNHRVNDAELESAKAALRPLLSDRSYAEVWIPIGAGTHSDHEMTRNACLAILVEDPSIAQGRVFRLYQDVPYDADFPAHTPAIVRGLERLGAELAPEAVDVGAAFADKLRLLAVFASQFKVDVIRPGVEASAASSEGGTQIEHFWRIERVPGSLDTSPLYIDIESVTRAAKELQPVLDSLRRATRIRLLVLMPAGRWAEDMRFLLDAFPAATFEVHAAPAALPEIRAFVSPRVHVSAEGAGGKAWLLLALRLMFQRPAPTIFFASVERLRQARALTRLWPMSRSIAVATMDHFVLGLRRAMQA